MTDEKVIAADQVPRTISTQELALLAARPETRIAFFSLAMVVTGAVQGFRNSWDSQSVQLIIGALASIGGMLSFGRSVVRPQSGGAAAMGGLFPYLFGCYVTFVRGLYPMLSIFGDFSWTRVLTAVVFAFVGYRIVFWTWQLSEIASALTKGRLVVK